MSKFFKVTGTATFTFTKLIEVDEDDDPESYEPVLYGDDILDDVTNEEIEIDSVELYKKSQD